MLYDEVQDMTYEKIIEELIHIIKSGEGYLGQEPVGLIKSKVIE